MNALLDPKDYHGRRQLDYQAPRPIVIFLLRRISSPTRRRDPTSCTSNGHRAALILIYLGVFRHSTPYCWVVGNKLFFPYPRVCQPLWIEKSWKSRACPDFKNNPHSGVYLIHTVNNSIPIHSGVYLIHTPIIRHRVEVGIDS